MSEQRQMQDATEKLLHAIEEVRDEARERDKKTDAMLGQHAELHAQHRAEIQSLAEADRQHTSALRNLATEVAAHSTQLGKLADAQVSVAKSSAVASELAAQALSKANSAQDDNRKMIESAMAIQSGAIASAVTEAIVPVAKEISGLKANDVAQNEQFALIVNLLSKLARWQDHWAVKAGVVIAGLIGAGIAGYLGAHH